MNRVADMNALLKSADACVRVSGWKKSVQDFETDEMLRCYNIKQRIISGTFIYEPCKEFILNERGKTRAIKAPTIADRVVQKTLNQAVLLPEILPLVIYDNGASIKNRGTDFARRRFETHLHEYYREHGTNKGHVLFADFSKYFDNLLHENIKGMFRELIRDEGEYKLFCSVVDSFSPDVSYMSPEEYEDALHGIYNSAEHIGKRGNGSKRLAKSANIGAEPSQTFGVFYPHRIDNYFKICRRVKHYGRYMDDIHMLGESREELRERRAELAEKCQELGVHLNERKTYIAPLDKPMTWLKMHYTLTDTGKLIRKLDHDSIVRERERIKYLAKQHEAGIVTKQYCEHCYKCWRSSRKKYDCHNTLRELDRLYRELIGSIDVYKTGGK